MLREFVREIGQQHRKIDWFGRFVDGNAAREGERRSRPFPAFLRASRSCAPASRRRRPSRREPAAPSGANADRARAPPASACARRSCATGAHASVRAHRPERAPRWGRPPAATAARRRDRNPSAAAASCCSGCVTRLKAIHRPASSSANDRSVVANTCGGSRTAVRARRDITLSQLPSGSGSESLSSTGANPAAIIRSGVRCRRRNERLPFPARRFALPRRAGGTSGLRPSTLRARRTAQELPACASSTIGAGRDRDPHGTRTRRFEQPVPLRIRRLPQERGDRAGALHDLRALRNANGLRPFDREQPEADELRDQQRAETEQRHLRQETAGLGAPHVASVTSAARL